MLILIDKDKKEPYEINPLAVARIAKNKFWFIGAPGWFNSIAISDEEEQAIREALAKED